MSSRSPKVAGRSKIAQILFTRSGKIYDGMRDRARKQGFRDLPFPLDTFRLWLDGKFGKDGEARCTYSGEIILVENFSIDHQNPISRGGSFALDNLVLCSEKENLRKGNMRHIEYVALKDFVAMHLPPEVQSAIWRKLEIGDVQRFSYYRRQKKAKVTG